MMKETGRKVAIWEISGWEAWTNIKIFHGQTDRQTDKSNSERGIMKESKKHVKKERKTNFFSPKMKHSSVFVCLNTILNGQFLSLGAYFISWIVFKTLTCLSYYQFSTIYFVLLLTLLFYTKHVSSCIYPDISSFLLNYHLKWLDDWVSVQLCWSHRIFTVLVIKCHYPAGWAGKSLWRFQLSWVLNEHIDLATLTFFPNNCYATCTATLNYK